MKDPEKVAKCIESLKNNCKLPVTIKHRIGVDNDDSLDRTQFLLARLQELKAWQKDQEEKLLRDQEEQMDQLACLPINQLGINASNIIDNNAHGLRGLDYVNANENMAWADIRRSMTI